MRAKAILPLLLLSAVASFAQTSRGARPVKNGLPEQTGVVRAVVVGISNYQHQNIPPLKYAHADARAFAQWLGSPSGGLVPRQNIQLMVNEQATTAAICLALQWLVDESHRGDQAIFYYAGHGDVETTTVRQNGYLLGYDSPAAVYAAGAVSLQYLQDIITTLCTQNEALTLVVADACHAGKLAGSGIRGAQLTTAQLIRQYARETKILSCQPEEFAAEGAHWGEGRGVFSYYLLDGLSGAADDDCDGVVTLLEIGNYLQKAVPAAVAPHKQMPVIVGNLITPISRPAFFMDPPCVHEEGEKPMRRTDENNIWEEPAPSVQPADSGGQQMYQQLCAALDAGHFFEPSGNGVSAYSILRRVETDSTLARYQLPLRRVFLLALLNEVQQALNALLDLEPGMAGTWRYYPERLPRYPGYLDRVIGMLGEKTCLYRTLMAKKLFFEAYNTAFSTTRLGGFVQQDSLKRIARRQLLTALEYDADAAYLHYWMGNAWSFTTDGDSSQYYYAQAADLAPNWVLPYLELTFDYMDADIDNHWKVPGIDKRDNRLSETDASALADGMRLFKNRQYAAAESRFLQCLQLEDTPRLYQYLAYTLLAHIAFKYGNVRRAGQYTQLAQLYL